MRAWALALAACLLAACGAAPVRGPSLATILDETPAPTLAAYGFFRDQGGRSPAPGVVAYDLINPLFSDKTDKHRFVFVPPGASAPYSTQDVLDFPVGTALIKTFAYGERYLETRLLIHKADGWQAYPYVWNAAQTDAVYTPVGTRIEISADWGPADFTYAVPNKNQCKTCHQVGGAFLPIGPKVRNLNHDGPGGVNQIDDWAARGLLAGVPDSVPAVASVQDDSASLEARARAYLDINCAHCHKASGSASNSGLWLDWEIDDPVKIGVHKHPTAAGRGAGDLIYVIEPGDPDASILTYRMASSEAGVAMPELGRALIDEAGVELIRTWVAAMPPAAETAD